MTIPKTTEPRRIQFDFLQGRLAEFDQLMDFCDLKTRKDLFDNAMTLFEWAVQEVRQGNEIASYNRGSDHVEVVRFPVLDNAARRARASQAPSLVDTAAASMKDGVDTTSAAFSSEQGPRRQDSKTAIRPVLTRV